MLISLTHTDQKLVKRLGTALQNGVIEIDSIRTLLTSLQQKTEKSSAATKGAKTSGVKGDRKNKYRSKLKVAI